MRKATAASARTSVSTPISSAVKAATPVTGTGTGCIFGGTGGAAVVAVVVRERVAGMVGIGTTRNPDMMAGLAAEGIAGGEEEEGKGTLA